MLRANEDIGDVLVLAEQRQVEQDLKGLSVGSEHDELGDTTVESLGGYQKVCRISR